MAQAADGSGDLLVMLLDVNLFLGTAGLDASTVLQQVLYFVGAYLMLHDKNRLAVYGVMKDACHLLHMNMGEELALPEFSNPTKAITNRLTALLEAAAAASAQSGEAQQQQQQQQQQQAAHVAISGALSRALCLIHRIASARSGAGMGGAAAGMADAEAALAGPRGGGAEAGRTRPRILSLVASPDVPMQYIPVMNAIFSAQRMGVALDALVLHDKGSGGAAAPAAAAASGWAPAGEGAASRGSGAGGGPGASGNDSAFLQQAAHLTGGVYLRPAAQQRGALLQYLVQVMSPDTSTRAMLRVHQPLGVDFRASCFCHKRIIDIGYACSVCLSIFCEGSRECAICGTPFTVKRGRAGGVGEPAAGRA